MTAIKRIAALAMALTGFCAAWSDGYKSVIVTLTDGSSTQINLSTDLLTDFSATEVIFIGGDTEVVFDRSKVASFSFSTLTGIATVGSVRPQGPTQRGGSLLFDGLPAGSEVAVFAADGRKVVSRKAEGSCEVPVGGLGAGTYVVSVNGMSYKFIVKK